jgi:small-conductance mechanosensitive channel
MEDIDQIRGLVLFDIGRTPVTIGGVISGALVIVAAVLAARLAGVAIRRVRSRTRHGADALFIVEKLVTYGLVILGVVAGLSTVGLNLSSLAIFAGAVGVGVGLGLQGIVKEFVSGLVLIFDRVLRVGDFVELDGDKRGLVQEIGPRAVRVRTNDDIELVVPNSKFIEGPVVNWTLHNRTRRIHIPFPVATGADRSKVRDVVLAAARAVPFTQPDTDEQKTQVWLVGFDEVSLRFELVVWPTLEAVKRPAAMHAAYTWAIAEALDHAGIPIPTSQLEVTMARDTAAGRRVTPTAKRRARANDAAEDLSRPFAPRERRASRPMA